MEEQEHRQLIDQLREVVTTYLRDQVTNPSLETVEQDFHAQDTLASLLLVVQTSSRLVREKGLGFDKHFLASLPREEIEKRIEALGEFLESGHGCLLAGEEDYTEAREYLVSDSSQKHLLAYFGREVNWIVVSVLSASYISSLILMRSAFELLVGIATRKTGAMKERLATIPFLREEETKTLLKLWYRLCGWGHPYGRWVKEVCPYYVARAPQYHPGLCATCFKELQEIVDFFMVVALEKYEIPVGDLVSELSDHGVSTDGFQLVSSRIPG